MLPDRVSNPGPLTYESGALPIGLRGPATTQRKEKRKYVAGSGIEPGSQSRTGFRIRDLWLMSQMRYRLCYAARQKNCGYPLLAHCCTSLNQGKKWISINRLRDRSGGAMVLGILPVPGRPTILITVGQGPIALAVGAGGGRFGHFYSHLSFHLFLPFFGRRLDID